MHKKSKNSTEIEESENITILVNYWHILPHIHQYYGCEILQAKYG